MDLGSLVEQSWAVGQQRSDGATATLDCNSGNNASQECDDGNVPAPGQCNNGSTD